MGKMKNKAVAFATWVLLCVSGLAHGGVIVHTSDFIDDTSRTHFMNFETLPNGTRGDSYYTDNGIKIHETAGPVGGATFMNGSVNYYHNHKNYNQIGYTVLTMADGSNFGAIGMDVSSGYGSGWETAWAILRDGVEIAKGVVKSPYLGFDGVDFDEIRLKGPAANQEPGAPHANLYYSYSNLIALDNIEVRQGDTPGQNIPEPGMLALLGIGGLAIAYRRRADVARAGGVV